jgi:prevent-host-death family protein
MAITAADIVPLSQARANLSELADQVKAGAEKIITKNGESYVALIDAERLDYYHQLEREKVHLILIDEASKGLDDIAAGRTKDARSVIAAMKKRRQP